MLDDIMLAIREVGESFMDDDEIAVYRYADDVQTWEQDLAAQYDFGDDEVDFIEPEATPEAYLATYKAWVVSKLDFTMRQGDGQAVMIHDHVIRVPVGSDIRPRDIVILLGVGERRVVFDTNTEDTHAEWMKVFSRGTE